jgi:hypothetical protein
VFLLKVLERSRRRIQHTAQLSHPLLGLGDTLFRFGSLLLKPHGLPVGSQQEPVAFRRISGKRVCVIHAANGCNNLAQSRKSNLKKTREA